MGRIYDLGIVKSEHTKSGVILEEIIGDFESVSAASPSTYVRLCWDRYNTTHPHEDVGTNGKVFEIVIATVLVRERILPFYMQAEVAFVPNIEYDFILYTADSGPLCLSTKTTLRERYKQADLEAFALKNVHRRAKSYLINISEEENRSLQKKITDGSMMGLDGSLCAFQPEFDTLIETLKKQTLSIAPEIRTIFSKRIITGTSARRS